MPKSKVRKKVVTQHATTTTRANADAVVRAKVAGPSSQVYIWLMLALMIIGLAWLVVFYLWGTHLPFMSAIGNWNFAVGFALMIVGLLMTMKWR